jgi:hypothetical protein
MHFASYNMFESCKENETEDGKENGKETENDKKIDSSLHYRGCLSPNGVS